METLCRHEGADSRMCFSTLSVPSGPCNFQARAGDAERESAKLTDDSRKRALQRLQERKLNKKLKYKIRLSCIFGRRY